MPRYRFSETVIYKSGNPWITYAAGEVYDLPADHGERWVRRQVAVEEKVDSAAALDAVVNPSELNSEGLGDNSEGLPQALVDTIAAVERGELSVNEARAGIGLPEVPQAPRHVRNRRP